MYPVIVMNMINLQLLKKLQNKNVIINFTALLPKLATLRVKSAKRCRVTNQIVYHKTFDLPHSTSR